MGRGQTRSERDRSTEDQARVAALAEAHQRLSEAEALVGAGEPGAREALQRARDALTRSSSYPPPPPDDADDVETGEAEAKLRARLGEFLRSLH